MHRYFYAIHLFVNRNKPLAVGIFAGIFLMLGFLAMQIRFSEDITKLIPHDNADVTAKVLGQLNFSDKITVTIHAENNAAPEDLAEYAAEFCDSVQIKCKPFITGIQGKIDEENIGQTIDFVYNNLPIFLDEVDYREIEKKLVPDSITETVRANYKSILSPSGLLTRDFIRRDPLGISFIGLKKLQQLNLGNEFTIDNSFVMTKDKKRLLLFITSAIPSTETHDNSIFAARLESIRKNLNCKFRGRAEANLFGSSLIAVANASQIKSDIIMSVSIAMTALMLILMLFYRRIFIPLIIFLPTVFGAVFAVAFLYVIKGTISAISLGIGSILIGITIDYSLHILTHYKHNTNIQKLYHDITMPLIMSGSTTAVAFLCLLFVNSEALQDLGIFAAVIVMASMVFSLLFVPHLYKPKAESFSHKYNVIDRMAGFPFHKSKALLTACLIIIIACLFTFNKVTFNNDLSQLNYIPAGIKAAEKELEENTSLTSKSIYLAAYGNSIDEALNANQKLFSKLESSKAGGQILNFSSVGNLALSKAEQQKRIDRWIKFWNSDKTTSLKKALWVEGSKVGFRPETYDPFFDRLGHQPKPVSIDEMRQVKAIQLQEFLSVKNRFYTVSTLVKLKDAERNKFIASVSGQSNVIAIDRQQLNESFLGQLRNDFNSLVNYSFIAVVLILFFFFRRIELVIISCIPIVITGLVTGGIMGIFDIRLNIFSTIVCTLIFGHGVDFSIFMTSALQKEYTTGRNGMAVYRTSIILAALTTILGIGAMVFAKHPALKSISSVSLIGVFAALIITFIFYPKLFRLCFSGRANNGKAPVRFFRTIHSVLSFVYFGLGGFIISVLSVLLMKILPVPKAKKMKAFHYVMSKFMHSVLLTYPQVSKKILNSENETFDKPAIIIANHSSFLDILAIGQLSLKIIFLVSDWVYHSPVFGRAVRLAGFYPVSEGLENAMEHLTEKINEGFSLMVFPEGTRSPDNTIKRFHKGAFYLAEKFNLDIVPVLIHGYSEVIPKGDFMIAPGSTTVEILPRIKADNIEMGTSYSERTKKINSYMREKFQIRRIDFEGKDYFRNMLLGSYDYKEAEIISTVKEDIPALLLLYYAINPFISARSKILHFADDYGQADALLALQHPQRKILCWIAHEEKRAVAKNNYLVRKRSIRYADSLAAAEEFDFDTLIIPGNSEIHQSLIRRALTIVILSAEDLSDQKLNLVHKGESFSIYRHEAEL